LKEYGLSRTQKEAANLEPEDHFIQHLAAMKWQLPTKRRETYTYCRYYNTNYSEVSETIQRLSSFQFYKFKMEGSDRQKEVLLEMNQIVVELARNYFLFGDNFVSSNMNKYLSSGTYLSISNLIPDNVEQKMENGRKEYIYGTGDVISNKNTLKEDRVIHISRGEYLTSYGFRDISWGTSILRPYFLNYSIKESVLSGQSDFLDRELENFQEKVKGNEEIDYIKINEYIYDLFSQETSLLSKDRYISEILSLRSRMIREIERFVRDGSIDFSFEMTDNEVINFIDRYY